MGTLVARPASYVINGEISGYQQHVKTKIGFLSLIDFFVVQWATSQLLVVDMVATNNDN